MIKKAIDRELSLLLPQGSLQTLISLKTPLKFIIWLVYGSLKVTSKHSLIILFF
jgi:hypothetical protein